MKQTVNEVIIFGMKLTLSGNSYKSF